MLLWCGSTEATLSISRLCESDFDSGVQQRGGQYHRTGKVTRMASDSEQMRCAVRGSRNRSYRVTLDWLDDVFGIDARCECPHYTRGELCKHIWASLLEADDTGWPDGVTPADVEAKHPMRVPVVEVYHALEREEATGDQRDLGADIGPTEYGPDTYTGLLLDNPFRPRPGILEGTDRRTTGGG